MKRKGQIVLVAMLAVIFLAGTAYADDWGWWKRGCKVMWKQLFKVKKQADWNSYKIAKLEKKVSYKKNSWNKHYSKKKKARRAARKAAKMKAMTDAIIAQIKQDQELMDQLRGEQGPAGPARPRMCGGCVFSDETSDKLIGVDFRNAELYRAYFKGTQLMDADFSGANCREAGFLEAKVAGTTWKGANLSYANLATDWNKVDLSEANVEGATWVYTDWVIPAGATTYAYVPVDIIATCPDGTMANANGNTCEGHLKPLP